ncbi:hypothetical protein LEMLEM_LOCUS7129, partial [Lemmus lemmus]
ARFPAEISSRIKEPTLTPEFPDFLCPVSASLLLSAKSLSLSTLPPVVKGI